MKKFCSILVLITFLINMHTVAALTASGLVGGSAITATDGIANINHSSNTTTITTNNIQCANSTVNWQSLNVGSNETLNFNFAGLNQTVLNKVTTGMTNIAGQMANSGIGADTSRIIISNPNGIMLDRNSYVNTNALVLTTLETKYNHGISFGSSVDKYFIELTPVSGPPDAFGRTSPDFVTTPNTGIVLKGKMDLKNDLVVASRGIRVEGAEISTGNDTKFLTCENTALYWDGPYVKTSAYNFNEFISNEGNLKLGVMGTFTNRTNVSMNPMDLKYVDGTNKSPDNLSINSFSIVKSKNGQILLDDIRSNGKGININTATLTAPNGINCKLSDFVNINNMTSDRNTPLDIVLSNPVPVGMIKPYYTDAGEAHIQGVPELKSLSVKHIKSVSSNSDLQNLNANSITVDSVNTAGDIALSQARTIKITNSTKNNDFNGFEVALATISSQQSIATTEYNNAYGLNANSLTALNNAISAKNAKDIQAVTDAANAAQNAADQAAVAAASAKAAAGKANSELNKQVAQDAVTGAFLKVSDKDAQAKINTQIAQDNATNAQTNADQAAANAAAARLLIAATQAQIDADAKAEAERLAAEKAEADRLAQIEADRLAKIAADAKSEADRLAKIAADKAEADRLAQIEADRLAKIAADAKAEADRLAKIAADKAEADRLAQIEADRLAKIAADAKAEADRLAQIEADRLAKIAADKAEADRLAKAEEDRLAKIAADKAEADRLAKIEADRLAKLAADAKAEADRLAKIAADKAESDRLAAIASAPKDDVNKMALMAKNNKSLELNNNNLLAQNIKSFAANESRSGRLLYKKTVQGFSIEEKIVR